MLFIGTFVPVLPHVWCDKGLLTISARVPFAFARAEEFFFSLLSSFSASSLPHAVVSSMFPVFLVDIASFWSCLLSLEFLDTLDVGTCEGSRAWFAVSFSSFIFFPLEPQCALWGLTALEDCSLKEVDIWRSCSTCISFSRVVLPTYSLSHSSRSSKRDTPWRRAKFVMSWTLRVPSRVLGDVSHELVLFFLRKNSFGCDFVHMCDLCQSIAVIRWAFCCFCSCVWIFVCQAGWTEILLVSRWSVNSWGLGLSWVMTLPTNEAWRISTRNTVQFTALVKTDPYATLVRHMVDDCSKVSADFPEAPWKNMKHFIRQTAGQNDIQLLNLCWSVWVSTTGIQVLYAEKKMPSTSKSQTGWTSPLYKKYLSMSNVTSLFVNST